MNFNGGADHLMSQTLKPGIPCAITHLLWLNRLHGATSFSFFFFLRALPGALRAVFVVDYTVVAAAMRRWRVSSGADVPPRSTPPWTSPWKSLPAVVRR